MTGAYRGLGLGKTAFLAGAAAWLVAGSATAQPSYPEPPPPSEPWYEAVQLRAFADGYYHLDYGFPKPQDTPQPTRFHERSNGFALSWVGLDAGYEPDPVGGMISLRFGPTARSHAGEDANVGLEYLKQAYGSWKPGSPDGMLTLDFGKFDTMVGAEVAESQDNYNYTRGALNTLMQPRFHTGLRATAALLPELALVALVANGWDRSVDNNIGKTFGLGVSVTPSDAFHASLAWIGGPEQPDTTSVDCPADTAYEPSAAGCAPKAGAVAKTYVVDRGDANDFEAWRHLLDLVLTVQPTESFGLVLNGNYGVEGVRSQDANLQTQIDTQRWYGGALLARWQANETWALAVRAEYLADPDGWALSKVLPADRWITDAALGTGTLTIEARVIDNLILRLENRMDLVLDGKPTEEIFREEERETSEELITTTLGVVVTTN